MLSPPSRTSPPRGARLRHRCCDRPVSGVRRDIVDSDRAASLRCCGRAASRRTARRIETEYSRPSVPSPAGSTVAPDRSSLAVARRARQLTWQSRSGTSEGATRQQHNTETHNNATHTDDCNGDEQGPARVHLELESRPNSNFDVTRETKVYRPKANDRQESNYTVLQEQCYSRRRKGLIVVKTLGSSRNHSKSLPKGSFTFRINEKRFCL
jgi:hypothetical protein